MYVGKARNLKARVTNYTRPDGLELRPPAHDRLDRRHGIRPHRDRIRSAPARSQHDQAPEAALQRAAARRQELPLYPHRHRSRGARTHQASRHETPPRPLFRPFRPRPPPLAAPLPACKKRSCCAIARTVSMPPAQGRVCNIRSSAAPAPAPAKSASRPMASWWKTPRQFLSGKSDAVRSHLQTDMNKAAEDLDFERAALIRDRLSALALIQSQGDATARSVEEADVFAIHHEGGQFCVQVFFFAPSRTGAITPIAPAPMPASPMPKCSKPSLPNSTKTAPPPVSSSSATS
jgi:excinuclease ABC subunit C